MTIQSLKHQYYIVQVVSDTETTAHYYAREPEAETGTRLIDLYCLKDRETIRGLIMTFLDQLNNTAFEDYYDCFAKDGELFVAFLHHEEPLLVDKLRLEECLFKERTEIAKAILQKILLLNMPTFLLYHAIQKEHIMVSPSLSVYFLYALEDLSVNDQIMQEDVNARIAEVFRLIFERELELEISEDLTSFIQGLEGEKYEDCFAIYQAYLELLDGLKLGETMKPNTFWFRVWERIKELWEKGKPMLKGALFLVLFGLLIYWLLKPRETYVAKYDFSRIGTLTIEQDETEEDAGTDVGR